MLSMDFCRTCVPLLSAAWMSRRGRDVRRMRRLGGRSVIRLLVIALPRIRRRTRREAVFPLSSNASIIITIGPIIASESAFAGFIISCSHCCTMSVVFLSAASSRTTAANCLRSDVSHLARSCAIVLKTSLWREFSFRLRSKQKQEPRRSSSRN